ncbi:MAG: hypothetical protein IT379_03490 [Deltaproteobacteria bacterium]|nr:hypothetical protein [Deltaproteobacteria bacterium]
MSCSLAREAKWVAVSVMAAALAGCAGGEAVGGTRDGSMAEGSTPTPPPPTGVPEGGGADAGSEASVGPPPPVDGGVDAPEASAPDTGPTGCTTAADCNDGDACTIDACGLGRVCTHEARSCDDGDACTTDQCDPALGCVTSAVSCDDGDACTTDACDMATGCAHEAIDCDDGDACSVEMCDRVMGCVATALDCDDRDACTTDSCDAATGCAHEAIDCDDGMVCTTDSCDSDFGCRNTARSCDDGNACTDDRCDAMGACVNAPRSCDDGAFCTIDACNAATGACQNVARVCDDGNACTDDRCDEATDACVSTTRWCDDGSACTLDSCNPATGLCVNQPVAPPTNDTCSAAVAISASGTYMGSVVCGADDVVLGCGSGGSADVFYTLNLATRSNVTLDTIGAGFDTVVELRSGSSCPGLTVVECDDNDGGGTASRIDRVGPSALDAGTYIVIVAGVGGAAGAFPLNVTISSAGPGNDTSASPTPIALSDSAYTTVTGSTAAATNDHTTSSCGCVTGNDVWYSFTLADRRIVYWHTQGSTYDVSVHIHQGSGTGPVPAGGCNDDSCFGRGGGTYHSSGASALDAGTYLVAVDGCSNGSFTLAMRTAPADANIGVGLANGTWAGTTVGMANDVACGPSSADVTHLAMSCPSDGFTLSASTCSGASWDTKIAIQLDSEALADLSVCVDDSCGLQSTATRAVSGIHLVRVVVDGFGGGSGAYSLVVSGIP